MNTLKLKDKYKKYFNYKIYQIKIISFIYIYEVKVYNTFFNNNYSFLV